MSDEENEGIRIYVLPTEEKKPPRALLFKGDLPIPEEGQEGDTIIALPGTMVTWSADTGAWMTPEDIPLPATMGDIITERAKELGVKW